LLFAGINVPIVSRTENTKTFIDYFKKLMPKHNVKVATIKSQFNSRRYIDCKKMVIQIIFLFMFTLDIGEKVNQFQVILFYNLIFLALVQTLV
jgi:hypothetical protein